MSPTSLSPSAPQPLGPSLQPQLATLRDDLLKRAKSPGVRASMQAAYRKEKTARRTGDTFDIWCRGRATQVAAAWVLSLVFVRTLEDRDLLRRRRIAGPGARDSEDQFTALAPFLTARDYLLTVFKELSRLPGAAGIFDARHNPVWVLGPSAEAARGLIDFFRQRDEEGGLRFSFEGSDTRFLGDLYQNLDEGVRKRFALLQTPDFIEDFILEQTLDPAVRTFGLEQVKLIDPTCGSGHFLLGAFRRLLRAWQDQEPATDRQVLAQRSLAQVYGADINPYAVAIARFRLTLAFLEAAGLRRLDQAPPLPMNLCVADSLLHGVTGENLRLSGWRGAEGLRGSGAQGLGGSGAEGSRGGWTKVWGDDLFALEDEDEALRILAGRYHAVVGNPPYIKEQDTAKRRLYLALFESASAQFTLSSPFAERFFQLAVPEGFVGMINANAFAKRDFGEALVRKVLPRIELTEVIDTSGVYIPGHGTPTLLLFGRNNQSRDIPVPVVLGKAGETSEPPDPASAPAWMEMVENHRTIGHDGRYFSVEEVTRKEISTHPWILKGGGALDLKRLLDSKGFCFLREIISDIGFSIIIGQDQIYLRQIGSRRIAAMPMVPIVLGDNIRDWECLPDQQILRPFRWPSLDVDAPDLLKRELWRWKTILARRIIAGTTTMTQAGREWFDVRRLSRDKHRTPASISFAFVATHNHFVFDRGGKVFNRSAPIIKLNDDFTENDHQTLLGYLNSSTVGLWCRLVMFLKGGDQMGEGGRLSRTPWEDRLEYAGNLLQQLPVPDLEQARPQLLELVQHAEATVAQMQARAPDKALLQVLDGGHPTADALRRHQAETMAELRRLRGILVSLQEEMDWRVYGLFKLPTITADSVEQVLVPVEPNWRPVEVRLARDLESDISARIWFDRHKREPLPHLLDPSAPKSLDPSPPQPLSPSAPEPLIKDLYRRRLRLIDQEKYLQLLETPENKRRWSPPDLEAEFTAAYRTWLLDRVEQVLSDGSRGQVAPLTARELADELHRDPRVVAVSDVYTGESSPDLEVLLAGLMADEAVPYVAALRHTETGMEKRAAWERTWELQRREDAGEKVDVPVPPKYATGDFRGQTYWRHRGKLDVPKERFVSFPGTEPEGNPSPIFGWAGWDHLQRAQALVSLYQKRKNNEGWDAEQLTPLLAGLLELVPWLEQWHNEPDPRYGGKKIGEMLRGLLSEETRHWGLTEDDLRAWRPETNRGRRGGHKKRAPALEPEALLALVGRLQNGDAGVAQKDLADELGVTSATVGKVAQELVDQGKLEITSGRPKRFRVVG